MGSRPHAILVYGFTLDEDTVGLCRNSDVCDAWKELLTQAVGCGKPDWYDNDEWSSEQRTAYREVAEKARQVVSAAANPVEWGVLFDTDTNYAFGIVLGETDWDDALVLDTIAPPADAEAKIKAACDHFGVEMQTCKLLLLAGYG